MVTGVVFFYLYLILPQIFAGKHTEIKNIQEFAEHLKGYFANETYYDFEYVWKEFQLSLESTFEASLRQGFDQPPMNVFVAQLKNLFLFGQGFQVPNKEFDVLFLGGKLRDVPLLDMPEVEFDLPSHVLHVEVNLGTIFVETVYERYNGDKDIGKNGGIKTDNVGKISGESTDESVKVSGEESDKHHDSNSGKDAGGETDKDVSGLTSKETRRKRDVKNNNRNSKPIRRHSPRQAADAGAGEEESPFNFDQVQDYGDAVIMADNCKLVGSIVTTIRGPMISLGHDNFQIIDCYFSIEISTLGQGSPPIIAPYLQGEKKQKEFLLLLQRPVLGSLMPRLQGTMFSIFNYTAVLYDQVQAQHFRIAQRRLLDIYKSVFTRFVGDLNRDTVTKNQGMATLKSFQFTQSDGKKTTSSYSFEDLVVHGLDTAYCAYNGGPYKFKTIIKIADTIIFNTVQVHGKLVATVNDVKGEHEFAAELIDVAADVTIYITEAQPPTFRVTGWRDVEFSILKMEMLESKRQTIFGMVTSYLSSQIPDLIEEHLSTIYNNVINEEDDKHREDHNNPSPNVTDTEVETDVEKRSKANIIPLKTTTKAKGKVLRRRIVSQSEEGQRVFKERGDNKVLRRNSVPAHLSENEIK